MLPNRNALHPRNKHEPLPQRDSPETTRLLSSLDSTRGDSRVAGFSSLLGVVQCDSKLRFCEPFPCFDVDDFQLLNNHPNLEVDDID